MGLPEDIISEARKLIDKKDLKVEDIIKDLNKQRKKYRELKEQNQQTNRELTQKKEKYEEKLRRLEERENNIISEARKEAKQIIQRTRKKTKKIVSDLKQSDFAERPQVDRKDTEIREKIDELEEEISETKDETSPQQSVEEIKVGDQVRVRSLGKKGKVKDINEEKNQVTIQAGIMEVTAQPKDLVKVDFSDTKKEKMVNQYRVSKSQQVSPRIDLRGSRFEEAKRKLDKYIDDSLLAGYKEVEIIHGKGSGALREAVSETLDQHPHISSFRLGRQKEGGAGVTIAQLEQE